MSSPKYTRVKGEEDSEPEIDLCAARHVQRHDRRRRERLIIACWITSVVILLAIIAHLTSMLWRVSRHGSFARGFSNELGPAKHLIELQRSVFVGSPEFRDDGTEYVPDDGVDRPVYVGEPSRSIDHEWALLHWGRFFLLSEDEARSAWGKGFEQYWSPRQGGYVAALEVMHTLHCLDHIRKSLYPENYSQDSPVHGTLHRDHCLDHIRQSVMCTADLTPIPSRFYPGIGDNYIDSDQPHTCRNWTKVRNWVSERYNGSLAVSPAPGTVVESDEWSGR